MRHLTEWLERNLCFADISKAGESNSDWPCLVAWHQELHLARSAEAIQLWYSNINQRFKRFQLLQTYQMQTLQIYF